MRVFSTTGDRLLPANQTKSGTTREQYEEWFGEALEEVKAGVVVILESDFLLIARKNAWDSKRRDNGVYEVWVNNVILPVRRYLLGSIRIDDDRMSSSVRGTSPYRSDLLHYKFRPIATLGAPDSFHHSAGVIDSSNMIKEE